MKFEISPQKIGNNALPPKKSWFSGKMGVHISNIRFLHLKGNFSNWTMMGERYPWWSETWHAGCQRWLPHPKELVGTTLRDAIVTTRINIPFLVGVPDPNLHLPLLLGAAGRSLLDWWGGRIHCSTPFGRFWLQCQCSSVVLGLITCIYLWNVHQACSRHKRYWYPSIYSKSKNRNYVRTHCFV